MACFQLLCETLLCILGLCTISRTEITDTCLSDHTNCCLPPAVDDDVSYSPTKTSYEVGETVTYSRRTPNSYLFGDPNTTCLGDDRWSGEIATSGLLQQINSILHDNNNHQKLFDGSINTCSGSGRNSQWTVATERSLVGIIAIKVIIRITSGEGSSSDRKLRINVEKGRCRFLRQQLIHNSHSQYHLRIFECKIELETSQFEIHRINDWTNVALCEIDVYTKPQAGCRTNFQRMSVEFNYPGITNVIHHGQNVSVYCRKGYRLEGDSQLRCSYGTLIYENEPKCIAITCKCKPPSILNGNWSELDTSKRFEYGSRLTVACNRGYFFAGELNFTECQANGKWSVASFTCSEETQEETLAVYIILIVGTVTGLVILVVISVLLWILCYKRRKRDKSQDERTKGISTKSSFSNRKGSPSLPPITAPFYSDPKDAYYETDYEAIYYEPYDSVDRKKTITSQEKTTNEPEYFCIEKENDVYDHFTEKNDSDVTARG